VHIEEWIAAAHPEWRSDWTKAQILQIVMRPFNWAVKKRVIPSNPFRGVEQAKGEPRRPLTDAEFQSLLRASFARGKRRRPERLLVERVVATWLQVNYAESAYVQANKPGVPQSLLAEFQKRLDLAQRGHLAATNQLATVRKLLKPALSPFDLLSHPGSETTVGTCGFKIRRAESVVAGAPVGN
jgi:hypothetical protein